MLEPTPPLVSIVLPTYNGSKYLGEAIDTCRAQTYRNWTDDELAPIVKEMARVLRKGVISLVTSARSVLYRLGKQLMEDAGVSRVHHCPRTGSAIAASNRSRYLCTGFKVVEEPPSQ